SYAERSTAYPPAPRFVFSSGPASPLCLHSFPTRRSSDLSDIAVVVNSLKSESRRSKMAPCARSKSRVPSAIRWARTSWSSAWARSEEHTSELQSRGHLVCRLLLEKKKNIYQCAVAGGLDR